MALCIEAGKPINDRRGEVSRLNDTFRVAAEEAVRMDREVLDLEIAERAWLSRDDAAASASESTRGPHEQDDKGRHNHGDSNGLLRNNGHRQKAIVQ
jgi:uncharacterized protein YecT (DUF1311 family)